MTDRRSRVMLPCVVPQTEQRRCCLRLRNLMTFDSGNYTCVVSNRHGQLRHTYSIEVFGTCRYTCTIILITHAKDIMNSDVFYFRETKRATRYLCCYLRQGSSAFVVVCLLATLCKNLRTDLHEIFREWANEQMIKFWWRSGYPVSRHW